jgi:hypothetical protein
VAAVGVERCRPVPSEQDRGVADIADVPRPPLPTSQPGPWSALGPAQAAAAAVLVLNVYGTHVAVRQLIRWRFTI